MRLSAAGSWPSVCGSALASRRGGGALSDLRGRRLVQTHLFKNVPLGATYGPYRCEDLERQTFPDASFDLVLSQDVFEYVLDPVRGFAEIARTLKPGGAHVFTIPWYSSKPTLVRASRDEARGTRYHIDPDYHGNPVDAEGSLVV